MEIFLMFKENFKYVLMSFSVLGIMIYSHENIFMIVNDIGTIITGYWKCYWCFVFERIFSYVSAH